MFGLSIAWATAMSLVIAGAARVARRRPHAATRQASPAGLFFLYLSTTSFLTPAHADQTSSLHTHSRTPLYRRQTCPLDRDTCAATVGLRTFNTSSHHWERAPQFTYHVAASYSAKGHKFNPEVNIYTSEVFNSSKCDVTNVKECKSRKDKKKRARSGQDAFFFSQVGTTKSTAFGVADGVGGWVESGVDPADFSHGLCEYMACAARLWPLDSSTASLHPQDLLQAGYDQVIEDMDIVGGGSTACLAVAEPDGTVEVANLGDSGFMHLGLNAVRHFTHPQTHAFNTPYQLSKTPQRMLVQMAVFGGPSTLSDLPKVSSVTHHRVRHGDVLVFATDGVWDNLSPQDVLGIVSHNMVEEGGWVDKDGAIEVGQKLHKLAQANSIGKATSSSLQARLAIAIAKEAKETSLNTRRDGPFAKEVQKHYPGENWHGGKPDDIAAVVAVVVEEPVE